MSHGKASGAGPQQRKQAMTVKTYAAKSSAVRAIKKATKGYEAFVAKTVGSEQPDGTWIGYVVLKAAAGRHLQEYLEERGMYVTFEAEQLAEQADEGPVAEEAPAEEVSEEAPAEEAPATDEDEAADEDEEADDELVAEYLADEFARAFAEAGGHEPRGRCKALRAVAAAWEGTRKEFVDAAVANGILPGTANANYQIGYKG